MFLKRIKAPYIYVALLIFLSFLNVLYAFRTNNYFSVDDFRVLAYFKDHEIGQTAVNFFLNGDIFGYRKIVGHLVFGGLFKSFGVNQNYFIVTMFLIQTINLILLFLVVRHLTKRDFVAFSAAVIFNKFYLFYFSNMHEIMGALFCLLSIYLFFKYPKKVFLSLASYVLALFSKELTFSLPFFLLALAFVGKTDKNRIYPYFAVLLAYAVYQAYFVFIVKSTSFVQSYGVTLNFDNLVSSFTFYLNPYLILFLVLLPLLTRKYKMLGILGVALITLLPVLFFGSRREAYYLYIPMIYLLTYLSLLLPKITAKTVLLYLVIILLFGGRTVFPKIAKQVFPDWQKVSMENVVKRVEEGVKDQPQMTEIGLDNLVIERDAKLMLEHGVLDLFVRKEISSQYTFVYNPSSNTVTASRNNI